jgi:hypothetical protein
MKVHDDRERLRLWFIAGFALVFVSLMFLQTFDVSPAGVVRRSLWQYYIIEIPRAIGPQLLGPGKWPVVALHHVALSVLGGAVGMAVGWIANKLRAA